MSTCRDEIIAAASRLMERSPDGAFTVSEVVSLMIDEGTQYAKSTIRTHVTSRMCVDAPKHHARVYDDLERVGQHRYRLRNHHATAR